MEKEKRLQMILKYAMKVLLYPKGTKCYDPIDEVRLKDAIEKYNQYNIKINNQPNMDIDKAIEYWAEKHSSLLSDYSKGNANNEVMQMYRSQMKNIMDFIGQLKEIKNDSVKTIKQQ